MLFLISYILRLIVRMEVIVLAYSTILSKGRVTIPKAIRDELDLKTGDKVEFELQGDEIKIHKIEPFDEAFHQSVEGTLKEWMSEEDEEAYGD